MSSRDEAACLCEAIHKSLKDANYKVCAGALAALAVAVLGAPDCITASLVHPLLPAAFDRLGDAKGPVRDSGRDLFIALMRSSVVGAHELVGKESPAWRHKNWRVREETLRIVERAFRELAGEIASGDLNLGVKLVVPVAVTVRISQSPHSAD